MVLRREVEAGLAAGNGRAPGRVTVTVGLQPLAGGQWGVATGPTPHVLTFEFEPAPAPDPVLEPSGWSAADQEAVACRLDGVFGPPGFDSAARATVFRETVSALDPDQLPVLWDGLEGVVTVSDTGLARAVHSVQRLLERGGIEVGTGARMLRGIFLRHPAEAVLELVDRRWRFGTGHDLGA